MNGIEWGVGGPNGWESLCLKRADACHVMLELRNPTFFSRNGLLTNT